jgi:hypothetical protein
MTGRHIGRRVGGGKSDDLPFVCALAKVAVQSRVDNEHAATHRASVVGEVVKADDIR